MCNILQKQELEQFVKQSEGAVAEAQEALKRWDAIPPVEQLSHQEWQLYFPGLRPDMKVTPYRR